MKAIVMAGGEGTRLRPLTCALPKPMVPLLDKPMLEYAIEHLLRFGITNMAFTLGYKPSVITDYFEDRKLSGAHIEYFIEDTPLGTAGSVKNAASFVDGAFLVFSGDALTDIDIGAAEDFHRRNNASATIVLKKMGNPLEYGVVISGSSGGVERFVEKPGWEDVFSDTINTGIYIIEPEVLDLIPSGARFDFAKDLFPLMMQQGLPIFGYVAQGYWCDVGNIEAYIKAHEDLLKGTVNAKIAGRNVGGIYVGEGAVISNSALVQSPSFIGAGAQIGDGARIGQYSCVGAGARVGAYANIKRSMLHSGVRIGRHTKLSGCVVGADASLGERCSVYEGAVVGERCNLAGDNRVSPHVRLWPEKWLHNGASAGENIVWGHGERTNFIGKNGFTGDMGEDLTPLRLGRIFGAAAEVMSGKSVALCSDGTDFADASVKQAAGIFTMSGGDVFTFRGAARPVFACAAALSGAGLCVAIRSCKGQKLFVDLFEPDLFILSKQMRRQLESRYFHQGEVLADMRCGRERLMDAAESLYIHTGCSRVDCDAIRNADIRIVVRGGRDIDTLAARALETCGASVKRQTSDVQSNDAALHIKQEAAHFAVRMTKNAALATLYLADGRVIDTEDFRAIAYYLVLAGLERKTVTLPTSVPGSVVSVARRLGLEVSFGSEQDALLALPAEQRRVLFDSVYAVCRLAEHIARTGATIEEITSMIQPGHVRMREVGCEWEDIGRVIGGMFSPDAQASEGLRFDEGHGFGYICPHTTHPRIIIRTEGDTEEFATELCEKYTDMVKRILKQPKENPETL